MYGTASCVVRRVIVPTNDKELIDPRHVQAGETMVTVPLSALKEAVDVNNQVKSACGVDPPSPRCAVVTAGAVSGLVNCDPALDTISGSVLIQSDTAKVGCMFALGVFSACPK